MNDSQRESMASFKKGFVAEVKPGYVRASIPEFEDFVTDWLPVLIFGDTQDNKSFAMPSVGAQVALLLDSFGEDGVCLGSFYSDVDMPSAPNTQATHTTYSDGAVIEYDPVSSALAVTGFKSGTIEGGTLDIKVDALTVTAGQTTFDSPVTINQLLNFTAGMTGSGAVPGGGGSMQLTGTLTHSDGSIISNGVVLHLHTHPVTAIGAPTGNPIASAFRKIASFFKSE